MKYKNCKVGTKVRLNGKEKILARDPIYELIADNIANLTGEIMKVYSEYTEFNIKVRPPSGRILWVNHNLLKKLEENNEH